MKFSSLVKAGAVLAFGLAATSAFAANACTDQMGHVGSGHTIGNNQTGSISGTPWGFEQWSGGGNQSMTYYDNGTFKANWSNNQDYLARVGFRYGDNGPGVDHTTKHYTVDYKYTKTGSAQYGYIGVYGWTVNPQVEYYIVDDWYSQPNEQYVGAKFGEITVDGATYTIHAFLRQQEPSKTGTSTFLQIFSIRKSARQCGHIDISAHFNKWDELFHGQTAQLRGSKGGGSTQLKFGKVTEVMLMNEAGGNASGSVDYTYFYMSDKGEGSTPAKDIERSAFKSMTIPGTIEAEDFDNGNYGVTYSGTQGASGDDGDHSYRGEDYSSVDIVKSGSGRAIGYTAAEEWLEYTVNVAEAGEYDVVASVSNGSGAGSISVKVGSASAKLSFNGGADWDTYEDAKGTMTLSAGKQTVRITINNDNTNVDYVKFTKKGAEVPASSAAVPASSDSKPASSASNPVATSSASVPVATSSATVAPTSSASNVVPNSSATQSIEVMYEVASGKNFQVFDMQGRMMGSIELANGASLNATIKAKFGRAGVYMLKQGNGRMFMARVK